MTVVSESLAARNGISDEAVALAFPTDATAPAADQRFALMSCLHDHYTAYLAGADMFQRIPRLNTDDRIRLVEDAWLRWEDARVDAADLPRDAAEFGEWFAHVCARHVQPEFCHYVRHEATLDELALFFLSEELVDSRFDDLVALVQIGAGATSKLTMAENYWDEMGEGELDRMHTRLFEHSAQYMRRRLVDSGVDFSGLATMEVYQNANIVLMYGIHRHLAPRALGAMGLMESTSPVRFQAMVDGCTRVGVPGDVIHYQRIHVHVDADHGAEWLDNVLVPLARQSPDAMREIALGVLTRERVAEAYYVRVLEQMRAMR